MPINLDHVGLNTLIQEPVTASTNTIGHNLGENTASYINSEIVSISHSDYLVSLNVHRNGPYGWPIFKQTRIGENPLTRYQRRNSIFTYVTEIGDVKLLTKDGKFLDSNRNRRSELRSFVETPVVSGYKPLLVVGSTENESDNETDADERIEIEVSFANETTYFSNDLANKEHNLDDELDEAYEEFVDLYLDGGLDSDDSPFDEFELLKFSQAVYPKSENSFSDNVRNRPTFESGYWKDKSADRVQAGTINNGFGFTVPSQSLWPLDVESNWKTRSLTTTIGFFTASAAKNWSWNTNLSLASGLNFSSGSNKILTVFSASRDTNTDSSFILENNIYKLSAEKGSLNSVEGTRRFWNSVESAVKSIGLAYARSNTYYHNPSDATFETGQSYKVPSVNDSEYLLNIAMTSPDIAQFRNTFDPSFTLSFRQLGVGQIDANGATITQQGTYLYMSDTNGDHPRLRFKRNSATEFEIQNAVKYQLVKWNGESVLSSSQLNMDYGAHKTTFTIDEENKVWRGWSSVTLEMPGASGRPELLINAVTQSSNFTSSYGENSFIRYNSTDSGPNYYSTSGFKTGSYSFRINPDHTGSFNAIYPPITASAIMNTGSTGGSKNTQKFSIVLTLNLGSKPTNQEGRGFSIFNCSSSADETSGSFSLTSFTTASSDYHSTIGFVFQSGSALQTDSTKFDKVFWNIPSSRANTITKFFLHVDLDNKSNCAGYYHNEFGITSSMVVETFGTYGSHIDADFDRVGYLVRDSKFFSNPEYFTTKYAIADIATLTGSNIVTEQTINQFLHSGSVLDYTSSYMASFPAVVNWYNFSSKDSPFRPGVGSIDVGSALTAAGSEGNLGSAGTPSHGGNTNIHHQSNPSSCGFLDVGLKTEFTRFVQYAIDNVSRVLVLTDEASFTNLISDGDVRIADYSMIKGVNRAASTFYANSGSLLYKHLDMTGSRLQVAHPAATASILYSFETSSFNKIQNENEAFITNSSGVTSSAAPGTSIFHISESFAGSIKPATNGVGQVGQQGMLHSGSQPFEYLVSNLSHEGLIENYNSFTILKTFSASVIAPTANDLFVGGVLGNNAQGAGGVLVNSYNTFNRFEYATSSTIDAQYSASCLYTRRHSLVTGSSFYNPFGMRFSATSPTSKFFNRENLNKFELYQGMAFWDAPVQSKRKPFFNDYSTFAEDPKLIGKDYSIIPEFKISDHIDKYLVSGDTSFNEGENPLFKIEGGKTGISDSNNDFFYETYSTTDFLKNFDIIQEDHEGFVDPLSITLRCKAIKKLLPYKGFYPADRTVEIAQQFYTSYGDNLLFGSDATTDENPKYAAQNLLTPLFSPGILFNSIKSGVACDYPLVTSKLKTLSLSSSLNGTSGSHFINQQFDTRIPFEALIEPEKYLANVELISNEPDEKASPQTTVVWNGQGDEKYRLMASNFLAEVGEFYLQNKNYSTISSLPQGDPNFGNAKAGLEYNMRLRMYRSISGSKDVYGEIKPRNSMRFPSGSAPGLNHIALSSSALDLTGQYKSISFWVNLDDNYVHGSGTGSVRQLAYLRFENYTIGIHYNDTFNKVGVYGKNGNIDLNCNDTTLTANTWNNIVVTFNLSGSSGTSQVDNVFVNGDQKSKTWSAYGTGKTGQLRSIAIGDRPSVAQDSTLGNDKFAYELGGSLQDFAIWNANFEAADAAVLYNQGKWLNLLTHNSASSLVYWWLLGEEPNLPISGSLIGDQVVKSTVGRAILTPTDEAKESVSINTGVGTFGTNTTGFTSPVPEGTFAVPQDTGSMSESITMYSRPSAFGPPQKLILSGSSKFKLKFDNWESFKKGNSVKNYYHPTNSVEVISNTNVSPTTYKDLEYNNNSLSFVKGNDASQGYNYPFTPPYYHGEGWADITFKATESKKYTLSEIINSSSVEFLRYYKPFRTSSVGEEINWRLVNEDAMQLASSINIFSRGILPGTNTTDLDIGNSYRWIVQSKFETPILDFSHQVFAENQDGVNATASVSIPNIAPETTPIGMWHQYGKIPTDPKKGIFMQITDAPRRWIENATGGSFNATASLADLCGFSTNPVKMGELGSVKQISEAIVAIPYIEEQGSRQFFKISKRDIEHALNPSLRHLVGQSLIDMTNRMKKFVLPPSMDFVINKEIEPFAMYIFDFTHTLTREDLSNIWQNLQPDISISHEVDEVEISHELLFHELLGGKAKLKPAPSSNNEAGAALDRQARLGEINPNLRWMVFKAKQRAKNNYFEKIFSRNESNPDQSGDAVTNTSIGKKLNVGFNWPYDFFSLVELGKIEADVVFANADDQNQEEKLVIKPRTKASKVLPKRKETDEVINNSLFGTGQDQPDDVLSAADKAKVKPNPLGNLSRRRRKK